MQNVTFVLTLMRGGTNIQLNINQSNLLTLLHFGRKILMDYGCLRSQKVNIYLLLHLNSSYEMKNQFLLRQIITDSLNKEVQLIAFSEADVAT